MKNSFSILIIVIDYCVLRPLCTECWLVLAHTAIFYSGKKLMSDVPPWSDGAANLHMLEDNNI